MESEKFKLGDVVRLNSGSHLMTVVYVNEQRYEQVNINVAFFNSEMQYVICAFPEQALTLAS